jgi:hypothetical protein
MEYDYEICWKCSDIYKDINNIPFCEKCDTLIKNKEEYTMVAT